MFKDESREKEKLVESPDSDDEMQDTTSLGRQRVGNTLAGHYEILSILGKGGMSTVYKARHILLDRIVAIKFVLPKLVHDEKTIMRFRQEAKAATALQHPNICAVKEFGMDEDDNPYLVMDFTEGATLSELIKKDSLDQNRILLLATQICSGLAHAHKEGVIHRDLKPDNIILVKNRSGEDQVKILDFGIAKLLRDDEEGPNLTKTGDIFGTPTYMSPEQCLGKRVDVRSDIYSLGALMFELATGKPPFCADSSLEMLMLHVNEAVPEIKKEQASPELASIIACCLRKDPEERYQTVSQLQSDLEAITGGRTADHARSTRKTWRKGPAKQLSAAAKLAWATAFATVLGVGLALCTTFIPLFTPLDSFSSAQKHDRESYQYFLRGEYEKALPLLEFGVQAYIDQVDKDKQAGNDKALPAHEILLAENYQHIGKCLLMIGRKKEKANDQIEARKYYDRALERYRQAIEIWKRYQNFPGSMMSEAMQEYAQVLNWLGLTEELNSLRDLAARKQVSLPDIPETP